MTCKRWWPLVARRSSLSFLRRRSNYVAEEQPGLVGETELPGSGRATGKERWPRPLNLIRRSRTRFTSFELPIASRETRESDSESESDSVSVQGSLRNPGPREALLPAALSSTANRSRAKLSAQGWSSKPTGLHEGAGHLRTLARSSAHAKQGANLSEEWSAPAFGRGHRLYDQRPSRVILT